jgi:isopenicillin N synthase-like dioxygenase
MSPSASSLAPQSLTDTVCPPVSFHLAKSDPQAFTQKLGQSFSDFGFAVVADHGIKPELIAQANADMKAFFRLDTKTKTGYRIPNGGGQRGYTPFGVEAAKGAKVSDLKEFWHVGRDLAPDHRLYDPKLTNIDVAEVPGFHAHMTELFNALDHLGFSILSAIARYLKLPADYFDDKVRDGNSILRLLHYPPIAGATDAVRAEAHEDINVITLLLGAEEAGLQLLDKSGTWRAISPPPNCVVINVGDMLQRLTNHVLPSTTHRVVNPPPERAHLPRYSMPFFLHFDSDFEIKTLEQCISSDRPNLYPQSITADDFLQERLREIKLT